MKAQEHWSKAKGDFKNLFLSIAFCNILFKSLSCHFDRTTPLIIAPVSIVSSMQLIDFILNNKRGTRGQVEHEDNEAHEVISGQMFQ